MKIYLTDQTEKFAFHLSDLQLKPAILYQKSELVEKTYSVRLATDFSKIDFDFFFNYNIFPENILTHYTQWQAEGRGMAVGDTILQQVYLPPVKAFSQKIIFGVRICEVANTDEKKEFSYETLEGHVEKGISTFTIERSGDASVFRIHTFSNPGHLLSRILGPVFSVPYQAYCTRAALKYVRTQTEKGRTLNLSGLGKSPKP